MVPYEYGVIVRDAGGAQDFEPKAIKIDFREQARNWSLILENSGF